MEDFEQTETTISIVIQRAQKEKEKNYETKTSKITLTNI